MSHDDTWLVASVPNAAGYEMKIFGDAWYALQLPTHLYHYEPETLRNVLAAGGWRMDKVFHHRNLNNMVSSAGYRLEDWGVTALGRKLQSFPAWAKPKHHYALYPAATLLAAAGLTGRMTIWARRA